MTEVYVLSREQFNQIADVHKKLAFNLIEAMARMLAIGKPSKAGGDKPAQW